jgi:hypothetical protein
MVAAVDLRKEVMAVVSLRTKVMTTETIKAKPTGTAGTGAQKLEAEGDGGDHDFSREGQAPGSGVEPQRGSSSGRFWSDRGTMLCWTWRRTRSGEF